MAPASGIIASAVILPESQAPPPSKRRQSSVSDSSSKRPRYLNTSAESPPIPRDSPQPHDGPKNDPGDRRRGSIEDRRKSSMQEEKKRGQRLFGGLLSTLSQSTPNGQQKRRQEVEKRQQEKAKQQKNDDETKRKEKLANLKTVREAEQIKFNEDVMRTKHANLLGMAHFLSTKSSPKLFYKPWEILPEQEERIKRQITDAEAVIEQEVVAFYKRYPNAQRPPPISEDKNKEEQTNTRSDETMGEPQVEPDSRFLSSSSADLDTTNHTVQATADESEVQNMGDNIVTKSDQVAGDEHNGEVVVENEEDTVIY